MPVNPAVVASRWSREQPDAWALLTLVALLPFVGCTMGGPPPKSLPAGHPPVQLHDASLDEGGGGPASMSLPLVQGRAVESDGFELLLFRAGLNDSQLWPPYEADLTPEDAAELYDALLARPITLFNFGPRLAASYLFSESSSAHHWPRCMTTRTSSTAPWMGRRMPSTTRCCPWADCCSTPRTASRHSRNFPKGWRRSSFTRRSSSSTAARAQKDGRPTRGNWRAVLEARPGVRVGRADEQEVAHSGARRQKRARARSPRWRRCASRCSSSAPRATVATATAGRRAVEGRERSQCARLVRATSAPGTEGTRMPRGRRPGGSGGERK